MRTRIWGLALVVLVLGTAACGNGSSVSSGQRVTIEATPAAMQRAADATIAQTAKVDFTMSMHMFGQDLSVDGTGAMDPANKRFTLSFSMGDLFKQLSRSASSSVPPGVASSFDEPMTVLVDGTTMYMHFPLFAPLASNDKDWIKIDTSSSGLGQLLGGANGPGGGIGSDPSSLVQFLRGADKVTEVGPEEIRGETTTHFTGTYSMKDALAATPEDRRSTIENAMKQLGVSDDALAQEIPFDAWLDSAGRVRRFVMTMDMSKLAPGKTPTLVGSAMTMSMEFYDFGTDVQLDIPSDDQVTDLSAMFNAASSKFSSVSSSIGN